MDSGYSYTPDEKFYVSEEWFELKADILERDEYMCRLCKRAEDLSVHHIIPRKYKHLVSFDIDSPDNLITLCWREHGMADRKLDRYGRIIEK